MPDRVCAFPGCGRGLAATTRTGLCRDHNHAPGLCICSQCGGQLPPRPVPSYGRTKRVEVPYPTSNSGVAGKARVSLPKEPWDNLDE